jgi:hypothetical protein
MDSNNKSTIDNENIPFTSALKTNKSTKINRLLQLPNKGNGQVRPWKK